MEDYSGTTNSDEREILSVTELNKTVNDFINEAFPSFMGGWRNIKL